MFTDHQICALVKAEMRIKELPFNLSFADAGFSNADLRKIQVRMGKEYHKTVSTILFIDTIYTLTTKLNGKEKNS